MSLRRVFEFAAVIACLSLFVAAGCNQQPDDVNVTESPESNGSDNDGASGTGEQDEEAVTDANQTEESSNSDAGGEGDVPDEDTSQEVPAEIGDDPAAVAAVEALGVVVTLNTEGQVMRADCKDAAPDGAALNDEQALQLAAFTHLTELSLENSAITDAGLDALVSQMPQLKILSLRRCNLLTDAGFAALAKLPNLERALLLYTGISNEGLVHIAPLTTLRVLDLRGCPRLGNAGLTHLAGLVNLVDLKLKSTAFYDTGLVHLAGMTKLRSLTLEDAAVTSAGMVHLAGMTDLRQLNLNRSYVDDSALQHFAGATRLQDLRLRQTSFTGKGLDHLPEEVVGTLTYLDLSEIRISDEGLSHAARFVNLKTLEVWNGTITDDGLAHLAGMHQLESLNLEGCPITSAGMAHLVNLTTLKSLNLKGTQIDDAALDQLTALTNLRSLSIQNNTKVTPEAVARFQSALPDCTIQQ